MGCAKSSPAVQDPVFTIQKRGKTLDKLGTTESSAPQRMSKFSCAIISRKTNVENENKDGQDESESNGEDQSFESRRKAGRKCFFAASSTGKKDKINKQQEAEKV